MRTKMFKLVVVLLVAGSGDTRPQRSDADSSTQPGATEVHDAGWRAVRSSNKSHDIVRDESRYTGTSGNNKKSYITHFRDGVDLSREHNVIGSRANTPNKTAWSLGARRSRIDDIWTLSKFQARGDPPNVSRTNVASDRISQIAAARISSEQGGTSFRDFFVNPAKIQDEKTDWIRSVLTSNESSDLEPNSYFGRASHSQRVAIDSLKKLESGVTSSLYYKSLFVPAKYMSTRNNSSGNHASGLERTDIAGVISSDDVRVAGENRRMLGAVRSNSSLNENVVGSNISFRRAQQGSHISSSFSSSSSSSSVTQGTNVQANRRTDVANHSIRQNRDSLYKITDGVDSIVASYEDMKSRVVDDPRRHIGDVRRDGLNNSGEPVREATLIKKSKPGVGGHGRPASRRKTSNRNFVRLRRPSSTSDSRFNQVIVKSRVGNPPNASNVALNLKAHDDVLFIGEPVKSGHLAQTAAKMKLDSGEQATRNRHSSGSQKLPSQSVSIGDRSSAEHGFDSGTAVRHHTDPKNWPNGAFQDIDDLYNYEKYTTSLAETNEKPGFQADQETASILSSDGVYINHSDPVLDSSLKKIIQWLKIPPIVPNNTHFSVHHHDHEIHKPIESVLESIYENLEPNRPLSVHDGNYETIVHQDATSQDLDKIDYHPHRQPNPLITVVRPQYATASSSSPGTLLPTTWSEVTLPKNSTIYNPTTHMSQNTVVHILNEGLKKPNVTVTQLKVPQSSVVSVQNDQVASSESSFEETSSEMVQRPNVHIMFTSQKDEDKAPLKQENNTFSLPTDSSLKCPTIMINSYTRVNNTIQSKEGCTDLNIIINSHILNTNMFKPSGQPTETQQPTSVVTQSYGDADESIKYVDEGVVDDLSHQDSFDSYVTAVADTYGSSGSFQSPYPAMQSDYYDSQKDPLGVPSHDPISAELSTVEVFQGTQISVSAPYVPLKDTEATISSMFDGVDGAIGSSVDGLNMGDDASNSALAPPVAGIGDVESGASVSGSPAGNAPATVNVPVVELPSSLSESGTVMGLANNGLTPSGTLQFPSLNLPGRPSLPGKPGLSSGHLTGSPHGSAGASLHDDDDDDDDDFDMTPGGVLQSMTSVFTYFTFLNPLGYSFFSLAAAPFAAMAAGVLGVAAFIFPWAFPSAFDFGRAADQVTITFRPNLEEFVRQAVRKYDRLNEWKSKRRKRRR